MDMKYHPGSIIQCYGGAADSGDGQLYEPRDLVADSYGNVLVADYVNSRVVLLSLSLTRLGYIKVPGHELSGPSDDDYYYYDYDHY